MNEELRKLSKEIWGKEMEKYVLNTETMLYIQNLKHENEQLQERIDKAIEYIDNSDILDIHHKNRHDLLNILKGDDK